jgi:hypothetical protein
LKTGAFSFSLVLCCPVISKALQKYIESTTRVVWDAIDSAVIREFAAKELREELAVFEAVGDLLTEESAASASR